MSRATLVYLFMAVCLVAGLWAILGLGSALRAPPDLAGTWRLLGDDEDDVADSADVADPQRTVVLEQSGNYFHVHFDDRPTINLKLLSRITARRDGRDVHVLELGGRAYYMIATFDPVADLMWLEWTGPTNGAFKAKRTARMYT